MRLRLDPIVRAGGSPQSTQTYSKLESIMGDMRSVYGVIQRSSQLTPRESELALARLQRAATNLRPLIQASSPRIQPNLGTSLQGNLDTLKQELLSVPVWVLSII